jgi:VWFA-related protein
VDVVITDHGEPVHGLGRSDFKIFEDGQERPIASFEEHRAAGPAPDVKTVEAQAAAVQAALPPGGYTNLPLYPQASAVNVLLLDELNTWPTQLPQLRKQLVQYLGSLKPGTPLAIFTLTSRLNLVTGFTTDLAQANKLLEYQDAARTPGSDGPLPSTADSAISNAIAIQSDRQIARQMASLAGPMEEYEQEQILAGESDRQTHDHVAITLGAFQQLAGYLSGIPGRKNLIWLSGSFPVLVANPRGLNITPTDYEQAVRSTMNRMAAARVAVYPVSAQGLMTFGEMAAAGTRGEMVQSQRETMNLTAELTGGKAYLDTNSFKDAMADAVESGASYYTIAYQPGDKPFNGDFRKIKVDIDEGHYTLNYRNGYYADPPDKPSAHSPAGTNLITEATLHGAPPMTQVLFVAQVLPATDPAFKNVKFPTGPAGDMGSAMKAAQLYIVNLTLDPHNVVFNQMPESTRRAELRFALVAYDSNGQRLNFLERSFAINVKPEEMEREMNAGIHARFAFDLPAGHESLRVAVEDLNASTAGSIEIPLTVAEK